MYKYCINCNPHFCTCLVLSWKVVQLYIKDYLFFHRTLSEVLYFVTETHRRTCSLYSPNCNVHGWKFFDIHHHPILYCQARKIISHEQSDNGCLILQLDRI